MVTTFPDEFSADEIFRSELPGAVTPASPSSPDAPEIVISAASPRGYERDVYTTPASSQRFPAARLTTGWGFDMPAGQTHTSFSTDSKSRPQTSTPVLAFAWSCNLYRAGSPGPRP